MKKIFSFLTIALVAICAFPLYASQRAYANFKSDGTYIGWGSLGNGTETWKLKGNTLTTYVDGEVYIIYKNITLNGNDMCGTMSQVALQ